MKLLTFLILYIILISCSEKKTILIDIDLDELTIDNKEIDKADFEERLKLTVDSLLNSGIDKSLIIVQETADQKILKYEMSEIEKAIRR